MAFSADRQASGRSAFHTRAQLTPSSEPERSPDACPSLAEVMACVERLAPPAYAENWDRSGLQIGDPAHEVRRIFLALDFTPRILKKAKELDADLILTHHPLFFKALRELRADNPMQAAILELVRSDMALYAAHTNLDACTDGVHEALAERLGAAVVATVFPIAGTEPEASGVQPGFVRVAEYAVAYAFSDWLHFVQKRLGGSGFFLSSREPRNIRRIALSGGSYDASWTDGVVGKGVDALLSGEIKYHDMLDLETRGIRAIAVGHDISERPVLRKLARYLKAQLPQLALTVEEESG